MADKTSFGARLRVCRLSAGLSQQDLADRSGISVRAIGSVERGDTRSPYPNSVQRLADGLGLRDAARSEFIAAARRRLAADVSDADARPDTDDQPGAGNGPTADLAHSGNVAPVVPQQLPASVPVFVGRREQLAMLTDLLRSPGGTAVTAIAGTAGVGKTALALQWAHQFAGEFPDGQLFVNLRGFDPSGTPVTPADAVRVLLEALQVPADRLPHTLEAQLGLYRSLLAGKRMLIVLDNAHDTAQVRPLLPGSSSCRVVITSRNQLTGLIAVEGARPVLLDVLTTGEARQLLEQRLGDARLAVEPCAAAHIIEKCARLPLALCVTAARAAMRPDLSLAQVAFEVAACQNLDAFTDAKDPSADVRAVFSWSYRHLDTAAARAFRLTGLHPGPDLDRYAAAALTGTTPGEAEHTLSALVRACLAQPTGHGRYGMHDLLRSYAHELSAGNTAEPEQAALTRLFDYYLSTALAAVGVLFPARRYRHYQIVPSNIPAPVMSSEAAARSWLDTQRPSLVAAVVHAADNGWPSHAIRLSAVLFDYLFTGAHHPAAMTVYSSAHRAASNIGDREAEGRTLNSLSAVDFRLGHYSQAIGHLKQSITAYEEVGDRVRRANTLSNLGFVEFHEGRCQQAVQHLEESLAILREADDPFGKANVLANLGFAALRQGRYPQATDYLYQALALFQETGDRNGTAHVLSNLGEANLRQGRHQQATGHLQQALALCRKIRDSTNEADILSLLGMAELRQRNTQQATSHLEQALTLCQQTQEMSSQAAALNGLGEVLYASGHPEEAGARHAAALQAACKVGEKYEVARAHHGLARAYQASGDASQAHHHYDEAVARYTELGCPEAHTINGVAR